MAFQCIPDSGSGGSEKIADLFKTLGPGHLDQSIRHAVSMTWMMLPPEKRNIEEVEKQVRRVVDRVLENLREDADAFGLSMEDKTKI